MADGKTKRGRPTTYNKRTVVDICAFIAQGMSVRTVAQQPGMPCEATIFKWLSKHDDFVEQYARASQQRSHARFESMDSVIEDMRAGVIDAQQARVQIDTIKWQTSKEQPKKYGDKVEVEHGVNDTLADRLMQARKRVQGES